MNEDELLAELERLNILPAGGLSPDLEGELRRLPHHSYPLPEDPYRPAGVLTRDGVKLPRVCFLSANTYLDLWGPDPRREYLLPSQVRSVWPSPFQLPPKLAEKVYAHGESGMGFVVFRLVMSDGQAFDFMAGGLAEFVELPAGYGFEDIRELRFPTDWDEFTLRRTPSFRWCLYTPPSR